MQPKKKLMIVDSKLWKTYKEVEKELGNKIPKDWEVMVKKDLSAEEKSHLKDFSLIFLHKSQFENEWSSIEAVTSKNQLFGTGATKTTEIPEDLCGGEDYLRLNWYHALTEWDALLEQWNGESPMPIFPVNTLLDHKTDVSDLIVTLAPFDILIQGYLLATYFTHGSFFTKGIEKDVLLSLDNLRSKAGLSDEILEKLFSPGRLFRPLCLQGGKVFDFANDEVSSEPFVNIKECNFYFDSVLYEVYSDCPSRLFGVSSVFTGASDAELKPYSDCLDPGGERPLLVGILKSDESLGRAVRLARNIKKAAHENDLNLLSQELAGGAIRLVWELIRSGLDVNVANHPEPDGSGEIVNALSFLFQSATPAKADHDKLIESLFFSAYQEYRKAYALLETASIRKSMVESYNHKRNTLNHNFLKANFLAKLGPFPGKGSQKLRMDDLVQELAEHREATGTHTEAIEEWKNHIKQDLDDFFAEKGPGPGVIPKEHFLHLARRSKKWISTLDDFVRNKWAHFFSYDRKQKEIAMKIFWEAAIKLHNTIQDLRMDRAFFKYFSIASQDSSVKE